MVEVYNNLKGAQMNMQRSLIQEVMVYRFKVGYNATETTTNICCVKGEGKVDPSTVNK